jgi:outer membrane lipase/esterase
MKSIRSWGFTAVAALLLAACGGGGDGDQSPRAKYTSMVTFGDSLSDVGTYAVSTIAAVGGGKYTVNGPNGKNWTELLAASAGVSALCAAQTGLNSIIPNIPAVPVTNHAGCFSYAQGGARVTNPIGPANINTYPSDPAGALGQLTVPVITQIANHLTAVGGSFAGTELVTVLAGGNDVFMNLAVLSATVAAGGDANAAAAAAVDAMGQAGAEEADYVKSQIVAKGAKYVVVVNLLDVSLTPYAYTTSASTQALINTMVTTFNAQLHAGLAGTSGVLEVDAYTQGRAQTADPAQYGVTNNTVPACDLTKTIFASSLVCTESTLISGDVSHYQFADDVHFTPYGYSLLAKYVTDQMIKAGWL